MPPRITCFEAIKTLANRCDWVLYELSGYGFVIWLTCCSFLVALFVLLSFTIIFNVFTVLLFIIVNFNILCKVLIPFVFVYTFYVKQDIYEITISFLLLISQSSLFICLFAFFLSFVGFVIFCFVIFFIILIDWFIFLLIFLFIQLFTTFSLFLK